MPLKIAFIVLLVLSIFMPGCSRLTYDVEPDAAAVYFSLRVKVNVRDLDSGKKQNFKAILKYNNAGDRMMFLSPLNQVYGLLFMEGERVLLINTKKKKYWRGFFKHLLREMWGPGMDFDYLEFKRLLVEGIIPGQKAKERGIEIKIEKKDKENKPARVTFKNRDILVKVKISSRKTGKGMLRLSPNIKGMNRTGIRELLE